ncbi:MAG TPA: LysM peptidoglycan-binding domain-containing protein [Kofleriaceae bacterium]|nr:LysM peptidoglycan-binding domain-containing protein [Kofleriaceae bacterium]
MRDALLRAAIGCSLVLCGDLYATAQADPMEPPIHAGSQPAPPVRPGEPVLHQELDGRRSIRGCGADERCARPGDLLREFELEAFPPPGSSPWIDERTPPASRIEAGAPRLVKRPSQLRPDAPWLDQLELPDLPIKWSQTLVDYLVFYKTDPRGRSIMESWLVAQGRYRDLILTHLRQAHLPEDLLYVAMIESGYDPGDSSSAGALGVWQFMPEGGRIYGLREDRWVDERRDPLRSTIAQMDYFADLHQRFADWDIALAAFNMGYGAMLRSIARYNTNDYYRLCEYENGIPWETCLYTPKILAAAIVGHNRALYGYDKLKAAPAEAWDEVAVPSSVSLAALAHVAGASEADLKRLNPQLRHGRTPPGETGYVVRVPAGTKAETQRRLVELESDWKNYDAYVIAHGERFEDVATTFGISVAQLRKLNDVTREGEIEGGTVLVVPRIAEDQKAKNRARAKANLHASGIDQKDGELLLVPVPDKAAVVEGKRRVFYRVVVGDTLGAVAKALAVRPEDLAQWNALDADGNLHPKMVLLAWVAPDFDPVRHAVNLLDDTQLLVVTRGSPEHMDLAEARTGRVRTEYVAQGKEKLAEVAKKFGMGSHDLARINRISYDTVLTKGQTIIVYQVSDPNRSKRADEQWRKTPRGRRGKLAGEHAARTASANVPGDGAADAAVGSAGSGGSGEDDADGDASNDASDTAAPPDPKHAEPRRPGPKPAEKPAEKPADADSKPSPRDIDKSGASPRGGVGHAGPVTNPSQVR